MGGVSDLRLGRIARALRHRLAWRQSDVARRARVSQTRVSRVERGRVDGLSVGTLRRILAALDAELVLIVRWRGGELDRLLDEGHAALVGAMASLLEARGWEMRIEASYSVYGERGSIDLLGWHPAMRTLLVVEVKTEITSVEETVRRHDVKCRLAARLAAERYGWRAVRVARLLVLPDTTTARRRVARHDAVLSRVYPLRAQRIRAWMGRPESAAGALLFAPHSRRVTGVSSPVGRRRVVGARSCTDRTSATPSADDRRAQQSPDA